MMAVVICMVAAIAIRSLITKDNTVEFIQKYNIDDVDEFFDLVEKMNEKSGYTE